MSVLVLILFSCSSTPKQEKVPGKFHHTQLIASGVAGIPLRLRRPLSSSADSISQSIVGEPNATTHCETTEHFLAPINFEALKICLQSVNQEAISQPLEVKYQVLPAEQPELVLDREHAPACLVTELSRIPIPREIIYVEETEAGQTTDRRHFSCFAMRLPIEKGSLLGIKLPGSGQEIKIKFPFQDDVESAADAKRQVLTWILTPFFYSQEIQSLTGSYMPDSICRTCFDGEFSPFGKYRSNEVPDRWPKIETE